MRRSLSGPKREGGMELKTDLDKKDQLWREKLSFIPRFKPHLKCKANSLISKSALSNQLFSIGAYVTNACFIHRSSSNKAMCMIFALVSATDGAKLTCCCFSTDAVL